MLGDERIKCSGDGRFSCRYDNNGDSHKDFTMTTREDRRFTAAVAAMQGLISFTGFDFDETRAYSDCVKCADALIAKLDETGPISNDTECKHSRIGKDMNGRLHCTDCNVGFIPDGIWA